MTPSIPEAGYLRLPQILGQEGVSADQAKRNRELGQGPRRPRPALPAIIPVSRSTWWAGVKSGRFPKGIKLPGGNVTVWRASDIRAFLEAGQGDAA